MLILERDANLLAFLSFVKIASMRVELLENGNEAEMLPVVGDKRQTFFAMSFTFLFSAPLLW